MRKWWRKVRRRRPGVYLARTRKHLNPRRRENGYVGRSVHVSLRREDHMGRGRYGRAAKPWSDLDPRWHSLRLPWWLGWVWVLAPLEALAILLLLPRYNHTGNLANPRRVPLHLQHAQRRRRDAERDGAIILGVQRQAIQIRNAVLIFALSISALVIAAKAWI